MIATKESAADKGAEKLNPHQKRGPRLTSILLAIPLAIIIVLGTVFFQSLRTTSDPFRTVLIDQPVSAFDLPAIAPPNPDKVPPQTVFDQPPGLSSADLRGQVSLVNIFGSWCIACRVEHALLMDIKRRDIVPIIGIDWKDPPGNGAAWLARFGNPYARVGDDFKGRVAIDFGVTGAPETFVVDHRGTIRYKHVGPITQADWVDTLLPLVQRLQKEAGTDRSAREE
ncbi:MAG: DsbE family thiol:disulfide interchange protein [Pseudomonadota bacterium]